MALMIFQQQKKKMIKTLMDKLSEGQERLKKNKKRRSSNLYTSAIFFELGSCA
jgi:hypothetical protein